MNIETEATSFFIFVFKDFSISVYLTGNETEIKYSDINILEPATENQRLSFIAFWKSYFQDEISMENLVETILIYIVLRLKLFYKQSDYDSLWQNAKFGIKDENA